LAKKYAKTTQIISEENETKIHKKSQICSIMVDLNNQSLCKKKLFDLAKK